MPEGYGIVPRALGDLEALETPVNVAPVNIYQHNTQEDTVNAAALMQKEGVAVIIVMMGSLQNSAQLTLVSEADVTACVDVINDFKSRNRRNKDFRLSMTETAPLAAHTCEAC